MEAGRFTHLTRWFLYVLIASIGIGAALAIYLVLAGNWGWFETRLMLTTGVIAAASVLGMACGAAISRARGWWLPPAGIGLAVVAAALLIAGMWLELTDGTFWKWTAGAAILAVSCGHLSLLSIATLRPSHGWVQLVAYALIFGFALLLIGIIFANTGSDWIVRVLAVLGILDAAFTLLVPVVYFLDRRRLPATITDDAGLAELDAEIARLRSQLAEMEARREAWTASHPHNPALQSG